MCSGTARLPGHRARLVASSFVAQSHKKKHARVGLENTIGCGATNQCAPLANSRRRSATRGVGERVGKTDSTQRVGKELGKSRER